MVEPLSNKVISSNRLIRIWKADFIQELKHIVSIRHYCRNYDLITIDYTMTKTKTIPVSTFVVTLQF